MYVYIILQKYQHWVKNNEKIYNLTKRLKLTNYFFLNWIEFILISRFSKKNNEFLV